MDEILARFNALDDVEKRAFINTLMNVETTEMYLEWTHKKKSTSKLKKDDLSDFVGHCEEIEEWFHKIKLWNKVFSGQVDLQELDVYSELVINGK